MDSAGNLHQGNGDDLEEAAAVFTRVRPRLPAPCERGKGGAKQGAQRALASHSGRQQRQHRADIRLQHVRPRTAVCRRSSKRRGVLAAFSSAGYIGGVLAYRIDRDLRAGLVLDVQLFTPVDLLNSPRMVRALLDAAERRAIELGCAGLRIRLYDEQAGVASHLCALGLSPEARLFWKRADRFPGSA